MSSATQTHLSRIFLLGVLLAFALGLNYLNAWTAPTQAPTGGNVAAPLNTGGTLQGKSGGLTLGSTLDIGSSLTVGGVLADSASYLVDMGAVTPSATAGIRFPDDTVQTTAGGGGVLTTAYTERADTLVTPTATFPYDDTIPQNTEGYQVFSQTITPKSTNSYLEIESSVFFGEPTNVIDMLIAAHFENGNANALTVSSDPQLNFETNINCGAVKTFTRIPNTSTVPRTFTVRVGVNNVATGVRLNGCGASNIPGGPAGTVGSTRVFGGATKSWIRIREYAN